MKILSLDSTATTATVCVAEDLKQIALFTVNNALTHSETLLPMIKSMLSLSGISINDIDVFAVSKGPGSFTGVRIGICTIKGLAFGKDKPCIGVSALEALKYNLDGIAGKTTIVCCVMDARRNHFYNALFLGDKRLCPDRCISAEDLNEELIKYNKKVMFVGDGYSLARKLVNYEKVIDTPLALQLQNAYSVSLLAKKTYEDNPDDNYSDLSLQPDYLRPSQAERTKEHG